MTKRRTRVLAGTGVSLGAVLGANATAQAATIEVDRTDDAGLGTACTPGDTNDCDLRGAIAASNASTGDDDLIVFETGLSGSITLNGTELQIADEVTVTGPGAGALEIDANDASRVLALDTDGMATLDTVALQGLTLTGGDSGSNPGGAIYNINAENLTINDSVLTGNASGGDAGAISSNFGANSLTIANSTLSDNTADYGGGAIRTDADTNTIETSTISGNTAASYGGGGIAVAGGGKLTVERSTFADNHAPGLNGYGGAIYFYVPGAPRGVPIDYPLAIDDSTIAANDAANAGGGIYAFGTGTIETPPVVRNSIVADNTAPDGADIGNGSNTSFELSFSLLESTAGAVFTSGVAGSNLTGVDPQLGSLAISGGSTATILPSIDSPVVDCGSSTQALDQRGAGFDRTVDLPGRTNSTAPGADGSDMGAVELQAGSATGACQNPPPGTGPGGGGGGGGTVTPAPPPKKKKKCKKKPKKVAAAKKKCGKRKPKK